MYTTEQADQIIGPTQLIDIDPVVVEKSGGGFEEILSFGILPADMWTIFFDVWTGNYHPQLVIRAKDAADAISRYRFLVKKGRYKITSDPAINAAKGNNKWV